MTIVLEITEKSGEMKFRRAEIIKKKSGTLREKEESQGKSWKVRESQGVLTGYRKVKATSFLKFSLCQFFTNTISRSRGNFSHVRESGN